MDEPFHAHLPHYSAVSSQAGSQDWRSFTCIFGVNGWTDFSHLNPGSHKCMVTITSFRGNWEAAGEANDLWCLHLAGGPGNVGCGGMETDAFADPDPLFLCDQS